ncbi:hypothetical protein AB0C01_05920 [Micromonospora sp. NPDC048905]|uniref:hypothetical protein n=1 Tax=Micromonospora sp. NPDC048905 TaxID=3155494 RepID=UPI0033F0EC30
MMPPNCLVCESTGSATEFTVVYFAVNAQEEAGLAARAAASWVGHPENAYWFCAEHLHLGTDREAMHWREAVAEIMAISTRRTRLPPQR